MSPQTILTYSLLLNWIMWIQRLLFYNSLPLSWKPHHIICVAHRCGPHTIKIMKDFLRPKVWWFPLSLTADRIYLSVQVDDFHVTQSCMRQAVVQIEIGRLSYLCQYRDRIVLWNRPESLRIACVPRISTDYILHGVEIKRNSSPDERTNLFV